LDPLSGLQALVLGGEGGRRQPCRPRRRLTRMLLCLHHGIVCKAICKTSRRRWIAGWLKCGSGKQLQAQPFGNPSAPKVRARRKSQNVAPRLLWQLNARRNQDGSKWKQLHAAERQPNRLQGTAAAAPAPLPALRTICVASSWRLQKLGLLQRQSCICDNCFIQSCQRNPITTHPILSLSFSLRFVLHLHLHSTRRALSLPPLTLNLSIWGCPQINE